MILIIDNYDSFTYNLYQCVAQLHTDVRVIRNDQITVAEITQLKPSGIILSPGPGRPEDAGICIELIQNLQLNLPILGVCLGLQAIVTAFGCRVIRAPEIVHGKHELIFHEQKGIYQHLPSPFQAGRYHSLMAERATLPKTLVVDAENATGLIMGVRHTTRPIFGVQFHPESILTPMGHYLLQDFVQLCVEQ
ncbi:aminodeoxychorismate/anthranilate synthase component II [bacterium]|nr:aminodeoxychorismate/anthranilate synthase component II [bacterium]